MTTLVGANNVGKSNILRALNLFFNRETEPGKAFQAKLDICNKRPKKAVLINVTLAFDKTSDKGVTSYLDRSHPGEFRDHTVPISLRCYANGGMQYTLTNAKGQKVQYDSLLKTIHSFVDCAYIPAIKDYKTIVNAEMIRKIVGATFQGWGKGIILSKALGQNKANFKSVLASLQQVLDSSGDYVSKIISKAVPRVEKFTFSLPYENLEEFLGRLDLELNEQGLSQPVALEAEGSGVQSFTILSMLRLLHELRPRNTYRKSRFVWLIEEPETFMHHDLQAQTFERLKEYASEGIVIVTTHSPVFMDKESFGGTYHVSYRKTTVMEHVTPKSVRAVLGGSLGISFRDFFMFNRFNLLVEGESDKTLLLGLNELLRQAGDPSAVDPKTLDIVVCRSANSIPHFFNLFSAFQRYATFFALFDRDKAGIAARQELLEKKYPEEDLILIPQSAFKANPAIEDIVGKKIWDKCLNTLADEDLVELVSRKAKGKQVLVDYRIENSKRSAAKERFTRLLLKSARHDLAPFEAYVRLLKQIKERCR